MNKQDEKKLGMTKSLLSFIKKNRATWQNSVPFTETVAELDALIDLIDLARQNSGFDQTEQIIEKNSLRVELAEETFDIASQLYIMAFRTADKVLLEKVDFQQSDLEGQRDSELTATCKSIVALGRENIVSLTQYDITEPRLAYTEELIGLYKKSLNTPPVSVAEQKANNEEIKALFLNSQVLLNGQLKRLMADYEKMDPDFYAGYLNVIE